ncbi:MAG TPA: oligosaccharide flippase family protein, partial [Nannocystaceae bacterium]|nr:oligosaccharide flippase family protein [Nannocystaceae bacterium]
MSEGRGVKTNLGSGGLALAFAKVFFLLAGYAISIALTRLVPPETFGLYAVVSQIIAVPNMVIIQSLLFTVSRPLAAELPKGYGAYRPLRRRGFRLALALGLPVAALFFAGADLLAARLHDPALAGPLRVVAPIPLLYALYAVNIGTLNATRRFGLQASLDVFMAASKAGLIIAAAALGLGLDATLGGFTLAAALALSMSGLLTWSARPRDVTSAAESPPPPIGDLALTLLGFTALVNLLLAADLVILKHFVGDPESNAAVGFYASANLVARVPYSLLSAVSLMMFPLVATLHALADEERLGRYVHETAKVTVMLLAGMAAVLAAGAAEVQRLLFPAAYGAVADELRALVWGFSGYSLAVTAAWILNSSARSRIALALALAPLAVVFAVGWALVPTQGTSGAAYAVLAAGGV